MVNSRAAVLGDNDLDVASLRYVISYERSFRLAKKILMVGRWSRLFLLFFWVEVENSSPFLDVFP